jgi:hypothetical protein
LKKNLISINKINKLKMTRVTQIKTNRITKMNKMISLVITILIFKIIFHQMILPIKFRGMIKIKQQLQINILKT